MRKILLLLFIAMNITFLFSKDIIYSFDEDFPPFTYVENDEIKGFEVDLIKAILAETDYEIQFKPDQWGNVQENLKVGEVQISSGMAQTDERKLLYNFSEIPISRLQVRAFVRANSNIKCFDSLKGKLVATQKGSWYEDVVRAHGHENVKLYETETEALKAVESGEADAFVGATKTAYYNMKKYDLKNIVAVGTPLELKSIYYALDKNDQDLLIDFNKGFRRVVLNGEYDQIYRRWFVEDLKNEVVKRLIESAREASKFAYAPYSDYQVGAAVLTKSGKIYTGCNVENALLGLSISALKVAITKAVTEGESYFVAMVNLMPDGSLVPPAADERQIVYEFGSNAQIILQNDEGEFEKYLISEMLPFGFELYK